MEFDEAGRGRGLRSAGAPGAGQAARALQSVGEAGRAFNADEVAVV